MHSLWWDLFCPSSGQVPRESLDVRAASANFQIAPSGLEGLFDIVLLRYLTLPFQEETEAQRSMKLMADTKLEPRCPDGMINCPKFPKNVGFPVLKSGNSREKQNELVTLTLSSGYPLLLKIFSGCCIIPCWSQAREDPLSVSFDFPLEFHTEFLRLYPPAYCPFLFIPSLLFSLGKWSLRGKQGDSHLGTKKEWFHL